MQAAIGVFLGDGDDEAKIGLNHFLLGLTGLALALLHGLDNAAIIINRHASLGGEDGDFLADITDLASIVFGKLGPAHAQLLDIIAPIGIELCAIIGLKKLRARNAVGIGQTQQAPLQTDQAPVNRIELFNQGLNTVIIELEGL